MNFNIQFICKYSQRFGDELISGCRTVDTHVKMRRDKEVNTDYEREEKI